MRRSRTAMVVAMVALVLAIVAGLGVPRVRAQTPHIELYFDQARYSSELCPWPDPYHPGPPYALRVYMFAVDFNMWLSAIEFSLAYPNPVTWVQDVIADPGTLHLGNSADGLAISWPRALNAYATVEIMYADILYYATPYQTETWVEARPHPDTGKMRAVQSPGNTAVDLVGGHAIFCGSVPVAPSTWGGGKALFD